MNAADAYQLETSRKDLAAGILKQAALDLRRFHGATTVAERELYLDAYSWINANDFSWPYSFVNVCKLLDLCPEVIRTELLADASRGWFGYCIRRAGRVSRALRASFVHAFTRHTAKAAPNPAIRRTPFNNYETA